jgi:hypothetical protein
MLRRSVVLSLSTRNRNVRFISNLLEMRQNNDAITYDCGIRDGNTVRVLGPIQQLTVGKLEHTPTGTKDPSGSNEFEEKLRDICGCF